MLEYLPHEVVMGILCRLPTKSLLRFHCVCKSWHSLIDDPSFISLHRCHSPSHLLFHLCELAPNYPYRCFFRSLSDDRILRNYSLSLPPRDSNSNIYAVFHCHGLLCLTNYDKPSSLIICNPSLRRFFSLPKHSIYYSRQVTNLAFGFDSRNCDYKIVRVNSMAEHIISDKSVLPAVEIYSFSSGSWKTLPFDAAPFCVIPRGEDASYSFVKGLVHWGAKGKKESTLYDFVLSFDFVDEVFHEIALPESLTSLSSADVSVNVVRGHDERPLTVYHCTGKSPYSASIWVMKEYGVLESWNKLFAFDFTSSYLEAPSIGMSINSLIDLPNVLLVTDNEEILLLTRENDGQMLYFVDVENRRFVHLQFIREDHLCWYLNIGYYTETLVVPNALH